MRESEYIKNTPISHRKEYGQFFTPPAVSRLMMQWVLKNKPSTILDPAFGLGVFYDEVIKSDPKRQIKFTGYEIDSDILGYLGGNGKQQNLIINNHDYLEAKSSLFDGIICNPPYMRFQKFLNRHNVLPVIEQQIGKKLIGYSNISSVFLIKALNELDAGGNLAFIMPFEFFNTGYGKEIKKSLIENNLLKQIIIFSNEKEIFPDATTTVCILLCRNDNEKQAIKITQISSNKDISRISDISDYYQATMDAIELPFNKKWTPIIISKFSEQIVPEGFVNISLYGSFSRGIATGANEFFALNKTKISQYNLANVNLRKCITKSSQIKIPVFTENYFNKLFDSDKPVYCLDVSGCGYESEEIINYIKAGEKSGYHKRYLTSKRNPWYRIEHRTPSPILFGVFNRGRLKVIRNFTTAISFTCFHSFYPNIFGESFINKLFVYFISDYGQNVIKMNKRSYGDGLDKFEPRDLNDCFCPSQRQFELFDDKEAKEIIDVAETNEKRAIEMSNDLIKRIINAQQGAAPDGNSVALHYHR